ncbi:MAG: prepilin peptidase [Bdellovibrionaceae bacterium]|nr:prepilin peptidase [Pseudobdellovibrionaceae bacterium]MBX3035020.1 prepilin peptidase [Pseudobdellovibrionaceae bacterium]
MADSQELLFTAFFFVFGALWGSFANVVIHRMPLEKSVVKPRSHCGSCGKTVPWHDNIPIASWFLLRGRCRHCGASFSFRYPVVEFLTAVLFAACFALDGWSWILVEHLVFVWALVACSFIDLDHMILPDEFTLSGIIIGLIGALLIPERSFWDALGGVLLGGGFLWFMAWLYYSLTGVEGMGGGDIKLLAWIGAVLGMRAVPYVIVVSAVLGSVIGLALAWKQKQGLKTVIPYGPYLALAAVSYLFGGQTLAREYWSFFLP